MNTVEAALFWLDQGVAPIPLIHRSKVPAVKWVEFRDRLPSDRLIEQWFNWQPRNLALVTGWQNLAVLDFDSPEAYAIFFVWAFEHRPQILDTYREQSSERGIHLFYYLREPIKLGSIQNALFEVKTGGKLVTTAPSVHESGRVYTALDDPANIRVVKPEDILNYSPVVFHQKPKEVYTSQFAPAAHTEHTSCIGEIKARVKILSFFPHAKQVDHEGRYWRTNCPFHGRKDNFWIDNVMGVCGCFAGCGHFDVIDLWAKLNNISNGEAIRDLEKKL